MFGVDIKKTTNQYLQDDHSVNSDASVSTGDNSILVNTGGTYTQVDGNQATTEEAMRTIRNAQGLVADNASENAWLQLYLAQTGLGSMGAISSQALRQMSNFAGETSTNAMRLADALGSDSIRAGERIAASNTDLARDVNEQNTGLLATLARFLGLSGQQQADTAALGLQTAGQMARDSMAGNRALAADSIAGTRALGSDFLSYGRDLAQSALDNADAVVQRDADTTRMITDQYSRLADKALAGNQDLAKVVNTGGQSDTNKTFLYLGLAAAAAFALFAYSRR